MTTHEFIIADGANDDEVINYEYALLVPVETLDDETKEALAANDTEKLLKWTKFPAILVSDLVKKLKEHNLLEELLEECRESRKELDADKGDGYTLS